MSVVFQVPYCDQSEPADGVQQPGALWEREGGSYPFMRQMALTYGLPEDPFALAARDFYRAHFCAHH